MSKRLLSILLTIIIMLGMTVTSSAQENKTVEINRQYEDAVKLLMRLGIIEDTYQKYNLTHYYLKLSETEKQKIYEGFYPNMTVTRAEFAMFALKLMGIDEEAVQGIAKTRSFPDVPEEHWAAGYIHCAAALNLISGTDKGYFEPGEAIQYQQAIKVVVSILGYDSLAHQLGGYPQGYISLAVKLKLTDGIQSDMNEAMLKGDMAKLFYNALFVEVMQSIGAGNQIKHTVVEKEDLLYVKFGIRRGKGQVTATPYTSLVGESRLASDEIEIDKVKYKVEKLDITSYLGKPVTFYYKETDIENTIVFLQENMSDAQFVKVEAKSILRNDQEFSKTNFVYEDENQKKQRLSISKNADIIINGKAETEYTTLDLAPALGDVCLLDADQDGTYEVIFIHQYINTIVGSLDLDYHMIYDKYSSERNIDLNGRKDIIIEKNGEPISVSDIKEWDVIALYESRNVSGKKLMRLSVSSDSVSGVITEISEDYIFVGGKAYRLSEDYRGETKPQTLSTEGVFYLDIAGNITAMESKGQNGKLAYLINTDMTGGLDPKLHLKLLEANGKTNNLTMSSTAKINGQTYKTVQAMNNELLSTGQYAGYCTQIVRYIVDSNEEIRDLYTVKFDNPVDGVQLSVAKGSRRYRPGARTFDGKFVIQDHTFVLKVPTPSADDETPFLDEKKYTVLKYSDFENYEPYITEAYNVRDALIADMVLVYSDLSVQQLNPKSDLFLVDKVVNAIDMNGNEVTKMYVWSGGALKDKILATDIKQIVIAANVIPFYADILGVEDDLEVTLTNQSDIQKIISELRCGDVLRFGFNSMDEIEAMSVEASLSRQAEYFATKQYHDPLRLFYGALYQFKNNVLVLSTDTVGYSDAEAYSTSGAAVLVYERKQNKISKSDAAVLSGCVYQQNPNVSIMLRSMEGNTREIIIVRD